MQPVIFVPDVHHPFHDRAAWDLVLSVIQDVQPRHLFVLGDFADCYAVSRHAKSAGRERLLVKEMAGVKNALSELHWTAPTACARTYVFGNHEARLEKYLAEKAPELEGLVDYWTMVRPVIEVLQPNWSVIPYQKHAKLGKVYVCHDVGYSGRYGAQRQLDVWQHCVVGAHTHRLSYVVEGNARGERHFSMTCGWLGDLRAIDYMATINAVRQWTHGFGLGWFNPATGWCWATPVPIVRRTCIVQGKEHKV